MKYKISLKIRFLFKENKYENYNNKKSDNKLEYVWAVLGSSAARQSLGHMTRKLPECR